MGNKNRKWKVIAIGVVLSCALTAGFIATKPQTAEAAMDVGRYDIAARLLMPRAEAGDAKSQNLLGSFYYLGLGVKKSDKLASKWFLASALQENAEAQVNIARQYQNGAGVKRDDMRAFGWLRQARRNKSEVAESYIKWQSGSWVLVPNQMQRAIELYNTLEDLIPSKEKGGL